MSPHTRIETQVLGAVLTPEPVAAPVEPPAAPAEPAAVAAAAPAAPAAPRIAAPLQPVAPRPQPFRGEVTLPRVGASGPIVRVGLDKHGGMVTPRSARQIAWLDNGSFPGPTRNAILAGHRNWNGAAGTFIKLEEMQPGDEIRVVINDRAYSFATKWVRMYDPDNAPVQELLGPTEVDSVTLITCGGEFNRRTRHYEKRWVVRGELVSVAQI